jgi:NUMOD1 domain
MVEVFDKDNNETTTYESMSAAAKALDINHKRIVYYFFE